VYGKEPLPDTDFNYILKSDFGQWPRPILPPPNNQEAIMGLPSNCTDEGAIRSFIRETYNEYSTTPMTTPLQDVFSLFYHTPSSTTLWGKPGYGGNPDLLLAGMVDAINAAGHMRPDKAGSV
jgi:hypothetical protein